MHLPLLALLALAFTLTTTSTSAITSAAPAVAATERHHVSAQLFAALDELARLVDIAYCVGTSGVRRPFVCLGRCSEFPGFELVETWNTGPLLSDSCGYIALDAAGERVVVAFRGTYSLANALVDLGTVPQVYVPYPDPSDPDDDDAPECANCTVHAGFLLAWQNTRAVLLPHIARLRAAHPGFAVHLVGHSLGGAVAALGGLELTLLDRNQHNRKQTGKEGGLVVTTFGEPRVGNTEFVAFLDRAFGLGAEGLDAESRGGKKGGKQGGKEGGMGREVEGGRFRRVTHRDDPVPLLPLAEWGYRMHAGEIYIAKRTLPPNVGNVLVCAGDADAGCIAGPEEEGPRVAGLIAPEWGEEQTEGEVGGELGEVRAHAAWKIQRRFRLWQLLFAHRDYFWRLGVCVPGGDPVDWWRGRGGGEL